MGKVTSRTALTTIADGDLLHVVDISDTTDSPQGTSKKSTLRVIRKAMGDIYEAELSIATAAVLTLNATPLTIVAAPGAGYAIEVIAASGSMTYNSIAYATNGKLQLITDTATKPQTETTANGFLFGTATRIAKFPLSAPTAIGETQLIANKSLKVAVDTGDPTAGNSGIKVYVLYRIITV